MKPEEEIIKIYSELSNRCRRISISTIKSVLAKKEKTQGYKVDFNEDDESTPNLEEAQAAFKKYTCIIFTAFRGGYTFEENLARNKRLKADMEELGMKYRPVIGCYKEKGWEHPDVENCYFAYNQRQKEDQQFFINVYKLSEKYDQDSFLFKRAGINKTGFLVASTDAGRDDLKGDFTFAGQLFIHVMDENAWTDCSDGRFAFQRRGMILVNTKNKKIKFGEGNLFDTQEDYIPDGLLVMRGDSQTDLQDECKNYNGKALLVEHVFKKANPSKEYVHDVIFRCLKKLRDKRCKKIGFHCSLTMKDSPIEGADFAYETIKLWAERYSKNLDWIVIVDIYGDYSKVLDNKNKSI